MLRRLSLSPTRTMSTSSLSHPPTWSAWRANPATSSPVDSTMFKNQPALPRLPVPALAVTLEKLQKSVAPLVRNEEERQEVERKLKAFGAEGGVGRVLQARLEARREEPGMRNWIAEWWDTDAYMTYRDSVVINVSYYYGFNKLPQSSPSLPAPTVVKNDQAYVAASIAVTALEFRALIASGTLEPEKVGKGPEELCMESYKWAFNSCRIPAVGADYATKVAENSKEGQFIVVVHKNHFYRVELLDPRGSPVGLEGLRKAFQSILDNSPAPAPPVGIMTGNNRDNWTRAYSHLSSSPTNVKTMKSIADSAFLIALDDASPSPSLSSIPGEGRSSSDGMREFSERLWKAGGKLAGGEGEGGNRWWDKILQWVVFKNGEAGFIGEHSPADGTPTARLNDFVSRRLLSDSPTKVVGIDGEEGARVGKLEFELDGEGLRMIEDGRKEFREHVGAYEVFYLRYGRYGKDGIKKMGFSPDAWTQMIFQLAYFLTHSSPCGTYEAAQVRKYQLGRTETVRICTSETLAWTQAMVGGASGEEKVRLFREAVAGHGKDMKDASNGMGVDRHLFGLKKLITEEERKLPSAELLADPLLARSATWNMSTSQIYIRESPAYGWGPVTLEGYGIPYMIHPECLQFTVTSHESMPGQTFLDNMGKAADMLMELMEANKAAKL